MKDNRQRLFEVMGKLDSSFKPKLNEYYDEEETFTPQGSYTVSNSGGYEIMLNNSGDAAKVRDAFGSSDPKTSDWLEIEYVPDEETGESEPVIDPNGYNIPLSQVMRMNQQGMSEAFEPDYSNAEYFEDKLEEVLREMLESNLGWVYTDDSIMEKVEKILQKLRMYIKPQGPEGLEQQ